MRLSESPQSDYASNGTYAASSQSSAEARPSCAPSAPAPDPSVRASDAFRAFLAAALDKDPAERPTAAALAELPFVADAEPDALRDLVARRLAEAGAHADPGAPTCSSASSSLDEQASGETIERTVVL